MLQKIISGGQTGADRAALDVAIELDIPHGGWIPKGSKTEDGILPEKYQLQEMPTASYPKRTEQKSMGVRPTQLTIKQPAFQKFRPDYDLFQNLQNCMNVEMCEKCRPDTHALAASPRST